MLCTLDLTVFIGEGTSKLKKAGVLGASLNVILPL